MEKRDELINKINDQFSDFEFNIPDEELVWKNIEPNIEKDKKRTFFWFYLFGAASLFIVGFITGGLFFAKLGKQNFVNDETEIQSTLNVKNNNTLKNDNSINTSLNNSCVENNSNSINRYSKENEHKQKNKNDNYNNKSHNNEALVDSISNNEKKENNTFAINANNKSNLTNNGMENENLVKVDTFYITTVDTVFENILPFQDDKVKQFKYKNWNLIASAGLGNLKNISNFSNKGGEPIASADNFGSVSEFDNQTNYNYNIPIQFHLLIQKNIVKNIGLETGISYSILNSITTLNNTQIKSQIQYFSLPIGFNYRFIETNKVSFEGYFQSILSKAIKSKYIENADMESITGNNYYKISPKVSGVSQSFKVGIGANLKLYKSCFTQLRVGVRNFVSYDVQNEYDRSKQKFWPELGLGFGYKL